MGRVSEAGPHSSQVLLVTDEMSAVPARVLHIGENGVIEGKNGKDLLLDYLLSDSQVKIGDEVVTSSTQSKSAQPGGQTPGGRR